MTLDSDAETSLHSKQKMWQEVDVYIYSSQDSAIRNAREKIYKHMKDVSVSRTEKDSLIANFDSKQVFVLMALDLFVFLNNFYVIFMMTSFTELSSWACVCFSG